MKCIFFASVFLLLVVFQGNAQLKEKISESDYRMISGVWQVSKQIASDGESEFSWGKSPRSVSSLIIDLGVEKPFIYGPGQKLFVDKIERVCSSKFVIIWHDYDYEHPLPSPYKLEDHKGRLILHLTSKESFWLEWNGGLEGGDFRIGAENPYFRTSGPN